MGCKNNFRYCTKKHNYVKKKKKKKHIPIYTHTQKREVTSPLISLFLSFLTVSLLSVVLRPEDGDFPENTVFCVIMNKRSFEPFMCLDLILEC